MESSQTYRNNAFLNNYFLKKKRKLLIKEDIKANKNTIQKIWDALK